MNPQNGEGLRTTSTASPGGTVEVDVGPNDSTVEVSDGSPTGKTSHRVAPGKRATIPIPNAPGGTILTVTVGTGVRARGIYVEVITPGP